MKLRAILILLGLFIVAMLIGSLLDQIPWDYRRWLGFVAIPVAIFVFVRSWRHYRAKEIGDRNEVAWLYEVVEEQERGIHDNRNLIGRALPDIEREHRMTPELRALIERAKRAIER